jgi:hypothetical protein
MSRTPPIQSRIATIVAVEILSFRIAGDSRATINGARNVKVVAAAIGTR